MYFGPCQQKKKEACEHMIMNSTELKCTSVENDYLKVIFLVHGHPHKWNLCFHFPKVDGRMMIVTSWVIRKMEQRKIFVKGYVIIVSVNDFHRQYRETESR